MRFEFRPWRWHWSIQIAIFVFLVVGIMAAGSGCGEPIILHPVKVQTGAGRCLCSLMAVASPACECGEPFTFCCCFRPVCDDTCSVQAIRDWMAQDGHAEAIARCKGRG